MREAETTERAERAERAADLRVPVAEERLEVEKRAREIGEVLLRRAVLEERRTVAVDVARETLRVTRRNVEPRPAQPAELAEAFAGGSRRIPVLGERAVAVKRPYVTGEVVVHRRAVTERRTVTETVRHTVVEPEVVPAQPAQREVGQATEATRDVAEAPRHVVAPAGKISSVWREVREGFSRGRQRA